MRKFILLSVIFLSFSSLTLSQVKVLGKNYYVGFGLSLDFFTNSEVSRYYNGIVGNSEQSVAEVDFSLGLKLSKNISVEFAPSLIFTVAPSYAGYPYDYWDNDPWWWWDGSPADNTYKYTYTLNNANLFALPLNLKMKYYPFNRGLNGFEEGFNFNISAGAMYLSESFSGTYRAAGTSTDLPFNITSSVWAPNVAVGLGFNYNFDYTLLGLDVNYRFVPMPLDRKSPLTISNAGNYNSLNFKFNIGYLF